jgi:hypothetical protein
VRALVDLRDLLRDHLVECPGEQRTHRLNYLDVHDQWRPAHERDAEEGNEQRVRVDRRHRG